MALSSPPGGPTVVTMELPCALSSPRTIALLRDGLTRLLQAFDFEVVAAVDNGPALLPALIEHRPDVAVVDVRLPPTFTDEGLQAAIAARTEVPGLPVLVLSQHVEPLYARELLSTTARRRRLPAQGPGVQRRRSSSTRSAGSPTAAPPWTPR